VQCVWHNYSREKALNVTQFCEEFETILQMKKGCKVNYDNSTVQSEIKLREINTTNNQQIIVNDKQRNEESKMIYLSAINTKEITKNFLLVYLSSKIRYCQLRDLRFHERKLQLSIEL
jgi:hypothetical protein